MKLMQNTRSTFPQLTAFAFRKPSGCLDDSTISLLPRGQSGNNTNQGCDLLAAAWVGTFNQIVQSVKLIAKNSITYLETRYVCQPRLPLRLVNLVHRKSSSSGEMETLYLLAH